MTKGKVVLVRFPFDDLAGSKVRPALCLTEPVGRYRHWIAAFVTSRPPEDLEPSDLGVPCEHPDFGLTGLKVPSVVRLHRLMTLPLDAIRRELGSLSPGLLAEADARLRALFRL